MNSGGPFAEWLAGRALNRGHALVFGTDVESAIADCVKTAAKATARQALGLSTDGEGDEQFESLAAAIDGLFGADFSIESAGRTADETDRPLLALLDDAVSERFDALEYAATDRDWSQAEALGIEPSAAAEDFLHALLGAMRGRPELDPLRSAIADEVIASEQTRLADAQVAMRDDLKSLGDALSTLRPLLEDRSESGAQSSQSKDPGDGPGLEGLRIPKRPLPGGYESGRPEEEQLRHLVLSEHLPQAVEDDERLIVALWGAGGFGKTTLAEWLIAQPQVHDRFERILWIDAGTDCDVDELVAQALGQLTGNRPPVGGLAQLATRFAESVGDRRLLIVVDDVWSHEALRPFIDDSWRAVTLVTTRQRDVVPAGAHVIHVDEITDCVAERIAGRDVQLDPPALSALLARAQGWPLLLRLLNRAVVGERDAGLPARVAVERVLEQYDEGAPSDFDLGDADDRRMAVSASIELGLRQLALRSSSGIPDLADAYKLLGVFPPDTRIPVTILQELWSSATLSVRLPSVRRACTILASRALVQRYDPAEGWLQIHDELREYLRNAYRHEVAEAHRRLLEQTRPPDGWGALQEVHTYWWHHLAWHLHEGGREDELHRIVADPDYVLRKVCLMGPHALELDTRRAQDSAPARQLEHTLRTDAACLQGFETEDELAPTLASRLAGAVLLTELREQIEHRAPELWLRPVDQPLDLPTPDLDRRLGGHAGRASSVAWASDGRRLAVVGDSGKVLVWDLNEPADPMMFAGPGPRIRAVAWSPSDPCLAAAGDSGEVWIWNLRRPDDVPLVVDGPGHIVWSVVWSPDGASVAAAGDRGDVWLISRNGSAAERVVLPGPSETIRSVAWSPRGLRLLAAGTDGGEVWIWDPSNPRSRPTVLRAPRGKIRAVAWSADGTRLAATCRGGEIWIWDLDLPEPATTVLAGHRWKVHAIAWAPDGRQIASAAEGGEVWVRDPARPLADPVRLVGHRKRVTALAWSPHGGRLASAGRDADVRIWNVHSTRARATPHRSNFKTVQSVAWSPDGDRFASAGGGGDVRIWNVDRSTAGATTLETPDHMSWTVSWSNDGARLAAIGTGGIVRVWDLDRLTDSPKSFTGLGNLGRAVAWSPDGTRLAAVDGVAVRIWDLDRETDEPQVLKGPISGLQSLSWSPEGSRLAVAGAGGVAILEDVEAEPVALLGPTRPIKSVAWSPDGTRLAAGGNDRHIWVWDPEVPGAEPDVRTGHRKRVRGLTWAPDGSWLASASDDGAVRLWQTRGRGHTRLVGAEPVYCAAWHPDGRVLATGSTRGWSLLEVVGNLP